jgi:hypothetical protein
MVRDVDKQIWDCVLTHVSGSQGRWWEHGHYEDRQFYREIVSVVVPPGITRIDACAFYGWISLESVTLPEGVTHIGEAAFAGCRSLASISFPMSLTTISPMAFFCCTSLASIKIPRGVTAIGDRALYPRTVPIFFNSWSWTTRAQCEPAQQAWVAVVRLLLDRCGLPDLVHVEILSNFRRHELGRITGV